MSTRFGPLPLRRGRPQAGDNIRTRTTATGEYEATIVSLRGELKEACKDVELLGDACR